jgi:hypothetical protein
LKRILGRPEHERLDLVAEGLEFLAEHVQEVRADVLKLDEAGGRRGLAILVGQLEEEAAKSLILLDLIRMGWADQAAASRQLGYFSQHLPRRIYADQVGMRPATFGEVRGVVESMRPSLYLDGPNGVDWIFRDQLIAEREQTLYVDFVDYESTCKWVTPAAYDGAFFGVRTPVADLVLAMHRLGVSRRQGLDVVAASWVGRSIDDDTHWQEIIPINRRVIEEVLAIGELAPEATSEDASLVINRWGYPMGGLDLRESQVDREALERQRAEWDPR